MLTLEIGGARFKLDPAAISAIRYRAEYGNSIVNDLADATGDNEREGLLLRMCHMMIPVADRPELLDFARLAHKDPDFLLKAQIARAALLAPDPLYSAPTGGSTDEVFDEYKILAVLAGAGVGIELVYELPILHLLSVANRTLELKAPGEQKRKMTDDEFMAMFPRR